MKSVAPITKLPATEPEPAAFDWQELLDEIQALGRLGAGAWLIIRRLIDLLRKKHAAPQAVHHCPDEHLHCLCCEAVEAQLQALALTIACCQACHPDNPEPEPAKKK